MLAALIAVVSLLSVVATAPAKSSSTPDSANEIDSTNGILGKQVSASWGGYSASAGLGGGPNGGGLFAGAGTPNGPAASAGLGGGSGGGSGYGGATAGNGHATGATAAQGGYGQGFFDHIFAIPIGVLQSVNKFLNQKGNSTKVISTREPQRPGDEPLNFGASAGVDAPLAGGGYKPQAGVSTTHVNGHREPSPKSPTYYDNVFDIPISALRGVNQFLNGGRQP